MKWSIYFLLFVLLGCNSTSHVVLLVEGQSQMQKDAMYCDNKSIHNKNTSRIYHDCMIGLGYSFAD